MKKNIQNQKLSETLKFSSTKSFHTVRQYFRRNRDSLSYWKNNFQSQKTTETLNCSSTNVSAPLDKIFSMKLSSPSYWNKIPEPQVFRNQKTSEPENKEGFLYEIIR